MGAPLASTSFINWIGEKDYQRLVKVVLHYVADLEIPVKRGTFIEVRDFRNKEIRGRRDGRRSEWWLICADKKRSSVTA